MAVTDEKSVLIADDHPLFRDAMFHLIERTDDLTVAATVASFQEAAAVLADKDVDIALVDIHMPDIEGPAGIAKLLAQSPETLVVAISGDVDPTLVRQALDAGARGYVPKAYAAESIVAAIRLIQTGVIYLPPELAAAQATLSAASERPMPQGERPFGLTPREHEVLEMMVRGATHKEIARALDLAEVTIKLHNRRIVRKLDARNRSEAIAKAVRDGIVVLE